jgi:hypothetical protein
MGWLIMSGMKISLDAAMRARDVSASGWQDDPPEAPDDDGARDIDESGATEPGANERGASEGSASEGSASKRVAGQPGADGRPGQRRRRLRRGRTT